MWAKVIAGKVVGTSKGKGRGGVWLPVVDIGKSHNPTTHQLTGPVVTVEDSQVTSEYTVILRDDAVDRMKAHLKAELAVIFQGKLEAVTAGYTPEEVTTWSHQKEEAAAYKVSSSASTPMLDRIAAKRGVTKQQLVDKVSANALAWSDAIGTTLGRKQAIEELIEAATTLEDLSTVQETEFDTDWN